MPIVITAGLSSLPLYAWLALGFDAAGSPGDVARFLSTFALLFGLYGVTALAVRWRLGAEAAAPLPENGRPAARGERRFLAWVLLFAALFRLVMLFAGLPRERPLAALGRDLTGNGPGYDTFLLYDNDVWRYLWDGRVVVTGGDPYAFTPRELASAAEGAASPAPPLDGEPWWDVLDNVSFQTYTSVYPPLAQRLFALSHALAPGSVFVWKLLVSLIDLGACLALAGVARRLGAGPAVVLLYAWNPLLVKEVAGSGHVDGVMVALTLAAVWLLLRRAPAAALACLGLAASVKLAALALVPWFLRRCRRRTWWALPAVIAAVWWPFRAGVAEMLAGLAVYGREWVFNTGPWAIVRALAELAGAARPDFWAHAVTKAMVLLVFALALAADRGGRWQLVRAAFAVLAALVVLNPAVMPWYLLWALPFAALAGARSWLVFTALALLSYRVYAAAPAAGLWLWAEWGLFALAAAMEVAGWRRRRLAAGAPERGPQAPSAP